MKREGRRRQILIAGGILTTLIVAIVAATAPLYAQIQPGSSYGKADMERQLARQAFYDKLTAYNQQIASGSLTVAECARYEVILEEILQSWDDAELDRAEQSKVGGEGARWIDCMYDSNYSWIGNPARVPITHNRYAWYHEVMAHPLWTEQSTWAEVLQCLQTYCTQSDPLIVLLAEWIKSRVADPQDPELIADALLSFVQDRYPGGPAINYIMDPTERPKYPIEMLYEWGGDCEDSSILLASLAKALGFGAALVTAPGHCMAAIALPSAPIHSTPSQSYKSSIWYVESDSIQYWICECTGYGYRAGDLVPSIGALGTTGFIVI